MRNLLRILALPVALTLAACATSFTGEAHFPGGVGGCAATCQAQGLEMSGFIYSGEFSSACVCRPPRAMAPAYPAPAYPAPSSAPPSGTTPVSSADDADDPMSNDAAAVGVIMAMQRQQQQQASANRR